MNVVLDRNCRFPETIPRRLARMISYGEDSTPVGHPKEVDVIISDVHERFGVAGRKLHDSHANDFGKGVIDIDLSNIASRSL
jgi:hypothetical protein